MRSRACERCGHPFVLPPKHPRQRFCSVACGVRRGADNHRFNGGLHRRKSDGRWVITCRDGTLEMYYRAVVAAHIGRLLAADEIVHHGNGDVEDDRIENLQIVTRAQHMNLHRDDLMRGRRAA